MKNLEHILSHSDCVSQEQMKLYLENELDKAHTLHIESHLVDCMFCSDALEGLQILSNEENESAIADIKGHFSSLLLDDIEANPIASEDETIAEPTMTATKGGKRISWAAIAGIFFLIFGGGLVVFSYINTNTNWFNKDHTVATTKGDTKDLKEKELSETKSSGRELETYSLTEEELDLNNDLEPARKDSPKEIKEKSKEEKIVEEKIDDYESPADPILANNTSTEQRIYNPPIPNTNQRQYNDTRDIVLDEEEKTASDKDLSSKKPESIVAKANKEDDFKDLAARNTYSQKRYEGKLKNINKEPGLSKVERSKSRKKVSKYSTKQNEAAEISNIPAVQSQGLSKKDSYVILDNYSKGNKAFDKGDYRQSIKLYKRALKQKDLTNRSEVLYQLARAYEKTNSRSKAEKIYEQLELQTPYEERARSGLKRLRAR